MQRGQRSAPLNAGTDPKPPDGPVDVHLIERASTQHDRAVNGAVRVPGGTVPGGLRCHGDAEVARDLHGGGDIVGVDHIDDGRRVLVDDQVPGGARLVPAVVAGDEHVAGDDGAQSVRELRMRLG